MSTSNSGNKTHDDNVRSAEGTRQSATATASQSAVATAEITFYRTCLASALANSCSPVPFIRALQSFGTGGV